MVLRWRPMLFYVPAGSIVVAVLVAVTMVGGDGTGQRFAGPATGLFELVAFVLAMFVRRRVELDPGTRRAWTWFAAGSGIGVLSVAAFILSPWQTFPAPGDILRLASGMLVLVSLLMFGRRAEGRLDRHKLALDVSAVVVAAAMLMWYLSIGPALTTRNLSGGALAAAVTYPVVDLLVLFGVALVIRRGVDAGVRRSMYLIAAGMLFVIAGNAYLGIVRTQQGSIDVMAWQLVCYMLGHFGLAAAAFEQLRRSSVSATFGAAARPVSRMPYLGIALCVVLLVVAVLREEQVYPWAGLVAGAVVINVVGALRQAATLRENHEMAITDALTGLVNRARLHDALGRALVRAQRSGQRVAVLLADLNDFKEVNDTLGHAAGDRLLKEFSAMLRRAVLGSDVVGRLGGDEFAVVLHDIGSAQNAEAVIRRLRSEMELPIMIGDVVVRIQAAIGYTLSEPGECDFDEVFRRADEEMYRVKRASKEPGAEGLADQLRKAASAGQLRVHYQPVVHLPGGAVTGVEALVRWQHPTRGLIPSEEFIPLAERTGAIGEIGAWTLGEACSQLARWRRDGHDLHLTVGLSPRQLEPGFADQVGAVLDRSGVEGSHLVFEVTESLQVTDPAAVEQLRLLRERGCRIAGYHVAHPVTAEDLQALLAHHTVPPSAELPVTDHGSRGPGRGG